MEEDEEISRNPPFWLQPDSTATATTRNRNLISSAVTLLLFIFFISSFLLLTPHFPKLNIIITNNNSTNSSSNNRLFKKGWESINITLVLLALLFSFLVRIINNNNNNNSIESEVNKKSHDERMDGSSLFYYPDRTNQDIGSSGGNRVDGLDQDICFSRNRSDGTNTNNRNDVKPSYADRHEISPPDNNMYFDENAIQREKVNTGIVLGVRDKIACVAGLEGVTGGEIVEFGDDGTIGIVTSYDKFRDNVGVAFMGEGLSIRQGSLVKATGKIAQVPENVSEAGLDPVVDASDDNILGKCEVSNSEIKEMPPPVRRRKRRTAESIAKNEKLSEETSGVEQKSGKISHRRTKSSGLELPGGKASHRKTKSSDFERFGTVLLVGNGVARIYGLDEVTTGEVVEFEDGTIGIVTNSESANNVGVVLMGDGLLVQAGSRVKATGKVAEIPVSEAYLGSVLNALAKPIDDKGKNYGSESRVVEEREAKEMLPAVRRRKRRTTISIEEKGKSIEETNSLEREEKLIHRKTKRTHEESVTMPPKIESSDEIEANVYESSPEKLVQDAPSPPENERNERKSATMDLLTSLTKRKKKHRQKSIEDFDNYDTVLEPQPPSPPPSKGFFSSKKGKGKKVIEVPPPSLPPQYVASREQKSASTTPSAATRRPPLPVKVQNFVEERESPERESFFSGSESPMHPIPPPPPPFKMSKWKFVVKGDYVNIGSVNSSRSVSPEREEVDSPMGSVSGGVDMATGSMFCPSPDVNSKADMFIAKFRAGLKLQKMNSMKMKPVVGFSNLGPLSSIDQAQA